MKVNKIIFYILNILNLAFLIYTILTNNIGLSSVSIFIIYSFIGLINILFKELKKYEYKRYKYSEAYYIFLIISGTIFLYINYKFLITFNFYLMFIIQILLLIVVGLFFYILERVKKDKNKDKNGPKFIANK